MSKFLFSALALAVALSLFASYAVAHDGGAAVLRALHQGAGASRHASSEEPVEVDSRTRASGSSASASMSGSTTGSSASSGLRPAGGGRSAPPGPDAAGVCGCLRREPGDLFPLLGLVVLPAHRCRPVRHQSQSAHRHAPRRHGKRSGQGGRPDPAGGFARKTSA